MAAPVSHSCPTCQTLLLPGSAQLLLPTRCPNCDHVVWLRTEFGPFVLRGVIGRGAMSVVFRASFQGQEAQLALKIIRPPRAAEPEDFLNFEEAAQRLVALEHPHCARVFAAGVEEGLAYVAMEYLPHGSLAKRLETTGPITEIAMLDLAEQVAAALQAGHRAGLLHGDLLPRRVRFAADGSARVTGFAESIFLDAAAEEVGVVRGRLCSLGPERLHGCAEDLRSDIFALGALLFESFTSVPPYNGEAHGEILRDISDAEPLRIERHGRPLRPPTVKIVNQLLRALPKDRPQSWDEACAAIREAREAIPDPSAAIVTRVAEDPAAIPTVPRFAETPIKARTWIAVVLLTLCAVIVGSFAWARSRQASKTTPIPRAVSMTPAPPAKATPKPARAKKRGTPAGSPKPKRQAAASPKRKKATPPPTATRATPPPAKAPLSTPAPSAP